MLTRALRAAPGRDKFETTLLTCEAFVKTLCCVVLAGRSSVDHDDSYAREHFLSRNASSLGSWFACLKETLAPDLDGRFPDWLLKVQRWLYQKRRAKDDHINHILFEPNRRLLTRLVADGDEASFNFVRVIHVLDFLVHLRNKTRGHGAKPDSFYQEWDDKLNETVGNNIPD